MIFRHIFLGFFVFRMFIEENEEEIEKVKRGQLRLLSPFRMISRKNFLEIFWKVLQIKAICLCK